MIIGAIIGATGAGKTALACEIAKKNQAEIISVDSRQVYQNLKIGTAQATSAENTIAPHHLQNFLEIDKQYSLGDFIVDVKNIVNSKPNNDFILVGGTGFYLKGLMEGVSKNVVNDLNLRNQLQIRLESEGLGNLLLELKDLDPLGYNKIDRNNPARVLRALEVCLVSGAPWSSAVDKKSGGIGKIPITWLNPPRGVLYDKINARVLQMFEDGWIEEVERALKNGAQVDDPGMQSIGYLDIVKHLNGELSKESLIQNISQATRKYAKRQLTYFRNQFNDYDVNSM